LEEQFFQSLCLLGGVAALFVVIPMNAFQNLSPWVDRVVGMFGLVAFALGWMARRGHYFKKTLFFSIVLCLDLIWFANGGSQGSIGLFFFSAALLLVLFLQGTTRYLTLALLLANIVGLHLAEQVWPQWVHPFHGRSDRLIDLLTGYTLSILFCILMLWVVLTGLNRERERLAKSENMYRGFFERQGTGFAILDDQERFLMANPVAETIFGVEPGLLVGRSLLEFLAPDQQDLIREEAKRWALGQESTYELRIQREADASRTLLVTATPRFLHDGSTLQVIGVFGDITDRKEAEDQLRESEERFRAYIEQSMDVIFTLNAEGVFLFASPAWERHFGYPVAQIVGSPFVPFVHPDDVSPCVEHLTRVLATGQAGSSPPYRVRHADGTWRWFRANGTRLASSDGALRYMGVAHDITERRNQELALQRLNRLYNLLSQLGQCLVRVQTREDLLQEFCSIAVATGGYPLVWVAWLEAGSGQVSPVARAGEAVGYLEGASFWADDRPEGRGPLGQCLRQGHRVVCQDIAQEACMAPWFPRAEAYGLRAAGAFPIVLHGKTVGAFMVYAPERDGLRDPEIALLDKAASDISFGLNRFAMEGEKAKLQAQLLQTQKLESLGSLAGGVAHDFNNMLSGIMGYADLLSAGETDPKRQKYLRSILAAASRSAELTQKLLAFGRRGRNLMEAIDLKAMIQDCLDMIRPSISSHVQVVAELDDCPTVDGDPSQIHQVVMNLCINAMEAMSDRGTLALATRTVVVPDPPPPEWQTKPGTYLELSVSDTGVGMTEEVQQRLFEPFFTTKNKPGVPGTGLGLSTAYGIVHAHGGAIRIESAPGEGSVFRVFLPVGALSPVKRDRAGGSTQGEGLILLVEDEEILREMGTTVLESLGYEVATAGDGVEAIEAYQRLHARLRGVLLDLRMPRMGGREAFLHMHNLDPWVPVIVCTGFGENEEVQELLTLGASGMLAKPYQVSALAAKLREILL
jgi:PAS domain S-box-containing protein